MDSVHIHGVRRVRMGKINELKLEDGLKPVYTRYMKLLKWDGSVLEVTLFANKIEELEVENES